MINLADLNPLLTKELRGRMRGWRAIATLTGYLFLLGGITWVTYALITLNASNSDVTSAQLGKFLLGAVVLFQLLLVGLLAPTVTAGIITSEREKQTYDLLMTTLLRPRSIILGKMGAALAWLLLVVVAALPLASLSFILGGVAPEELILALVVLLAATYFYGAIGLFWSSVVRSTIVAVVLSLITIAMLTVVLPIFYYMFVAFLFLTNRAPVPATPWYQTTPALYINELLLSVHPVYALARSEFYLMDGKPLFILTTSLGGFSVWLPHPWLVFTVVSVVLGTLLVLLAIRNLSPVRRRGHARPLPNEMVPPPAPGALPPILAAAMSGPAPLPPPPPPATVDAARVAPAGAMPERNPAAPDSVSFIEGRTVAPPSSEEPHPKS